MTSRNSIIKTKPGSKIVFKNTHTGHILGEFIKNVFLTIVKAHAANSNGAQSKSVVQVIDNESNQMIVNQSVHQFGDSRTNITNDNRTAIAHSDEDSMMHHSQDGEVYPVIDKVYSVADEQYHSVENKNIIDLANEDEYNEKQHSEHPFWQFSIYSV
ncbi:unnamed protein product [Rotaria magnacalcarata]|uniref:Uncharacterized protein n=2 Tax=Rotaria magnacalcarata TaxID=392030 RepID=A0A816WYC8_9BILA|nr:unnamed protein product [Rotaria magnacalcarata]CAF1659794.1 unnamed protein product [Rotaria magnacalcarata]CAF2139991.1 unnamed protein product [Rotaria magnacalcarata]CAF4050167.1 unnamed protein product [Rotaria magnacalcarata]CAF4139782.1 unnamed protein product [Rotaria magnacalcarata]